MLINKTTENMKQIEMNQRTFGKATQKEIKKMIPSAAKVSTIGKDKIIKDANGVTVATWHAPDAIRKNGLLVIR